MSCDYNVPMMHGLISAQFIDELRLSPSFDKASFAREYLGSWTGGSEDSWFRYDKLSKYRKLKNPENYAINRGTNEQFYLLSADIGRYNDQTVVSVFHVYIKNGRYYTSLVNMFVLGLKPETKPFSIQAAHLKELIERYNPKEVVVDTNGLGAAMADELIKEQIGPNGKFYPAYGFKNDDNYKKIQPRDAKQILYGIKATAALNSKIASNCFSRLSNGMVKFLIKEDEAKTELLNTKKGQRMKIEKQMQRLMPHELTTKLFEEMSNLKLKTTATTDIVLEKINTRFPKDKYSSFSYGLWRIRELEEEHHSRKRREKNSEVGIFTFYTRRRG